MKPFKLFFGASGQIGSSNVTSDPQYKLVVDTVNQLRDRLLNGEVLRQPFLHLFNTVYQDSSQFPDDLKTHTPLTATDQVSNMSKIKQLEDHPPTDDDVVDFLTNSFPDLYLPPGSIGPEGENYDETVSGRGEADKEKIAINIRLVQLCQLQTVSALDFTYVLRSCKYLLQAHTVVAVSSASLWFLFIATFLHELSHSSLVWYGKGACDSPQPSEIAREAGESIEKAFFGGISCAEFNLEPLCLVEIGLMNAGSFYTISESHI
jgi:hypothetical protein